MFLSAKKYLEDSAKSATSGADQLLTHTSRIINTVKVYENCHTCQAQISVLGNYLTSQNTCRMCCKLFCGNCIAKSSVNVPNHLLDITFQNKTAHVQPERQFLCVRRCTPRVVNACMMAFRNEITARFDDYVNIYLSDERAQHFFFAIPKESPEDTAYRKALRMIHIVGAVAGMSGYAMTYNAVKYAYYSSELVNILTEGNILGILTPLLESLKQCGIGITGPTAVLRLYYLGCYHTLQAKVDTSRRSILYEQHQSGVIYPECPQAVLEYVNSYLSAAQWMYMSSLPPPHQDNDWGSWYLSQIIRKQGWSLLMCINDSSKIPDGSKCPAFALVTRCFQTQDGVVVKEAMLVIRGSKTVMDWSINLEEEMCDYTYTHIVPQDSPYLPTSAGNAGSPSADELCTNTVQGTIHKGLYTAAVGLLEGYNLRTTLLRLLSTDYTVKVVGHSLGAGIAALIAAELRVTIIAKHLHMYEHPTESDSMKGLPVSGQKVDSSGAPNSPGTPSPVQTGVNRPATGTRVPSYLHSVVSAISAVCFSSPAFLTINLAEAFQADRLLINTVYDKDIIPRFSFKTIQLMAEELKDPDFCTQADLWTQQDKSDFSDYAISMGKAADIYKTGLAAAETAPADSDVAVPVAEALVSDAMATMEAVPVSASADGTTSTTAAAAPPKPSKPPRPEKVKSVTSTDSTTSYATADEDGGGSAKVGTTSAASAPAAAAAAPAPAPTDYSSLLGKNFSMKLHSLAMTAIDRLQTMNNEAGASAETRQSRVGQPEPNVATPATASYTTSSTATAEASADGTVTSTGTGAVATVPAVTPPKPKVHTVTPGPIVHLYKENDGTVHGAVVTHAHSSFQRMQIIPAHSADDHLMGSVREGMRSALYQHQLAAANMPHSPVYQCKKRPRGIESSDAATKACTASAEVYGSAEDKAKFERYFDLPAAGVHNYYPASGSGPSPVHLNVSGVKATPLDSANTSDTTGGKADGKEGANTCEGDVLAATVDYTRSTTGVMPAMPPKVYRSISAENSTDSYTYTSAPMTSTTAAGGAEDCVAVEAHPAVLTATAVEAYAFDSNSGAGSGKDAKDKDVKEKGTFASKPTATGKAGPSKQWVPCSVCGLDVTWPYVLHSDASRAIVAHNCRKCGEVVCSLCAPAGDSLPGDGLNQSYQLSDYRVSLPELGLFAPQRVCLLCYFDT